MMCIYSTRDRSSIIRAVDSQKELVRGYDMRTEKFVSVRKGDLVKETEQTVFRTIGAKEFDVIGRVAGSLLNDGVSLATIAHNVGVSVRTIRRYVSLNEML